MGNSSFSHKGHGYRIIQIDPDSFGANLNLEIFLDYIVEIRTDSQNSVNEGLNLLESDEPIELSIYNIISKEIRKIYISEPRQSRSLGLHIRYESTEPLLLHVTNVLSGSPAEQCGLNNDHNYVLGMMSHRYSTIDEFSDIVTGQAYLKQMIELCVYTPNQIPKIIQLEPKFNWGGPGALGCEFATGAMHLLNVNKLSESHNRQQQQTKYQETQQQEKLEENKQIISEQPQIIQENITKEPINNLKQQQDLQQSDIIEQKEDINKLENSIKDEHIENIEQNENLKDSQIISVTNILQDLETQQKSQCEIFVETPTQTQEEQNSNQQQFETHKFKGILRFQQEGQEQYLETQNNDNSFSQKNASSDYSHIQQNETITQSTIQQETNELKPVVQKYANQLIYQSEKREQVYVVDKKLLFDVHFEVPKYFVNIY